MDEQIITVSLLIYMFYLLYLFIVYQVFFDKLLILFCFNQFQNFTEKQISKIHIKLSL